MLLSLCPVSFFTSVAQFNYINDFVTLHLVLWINKFYDFVQVVAPPWEWKVAQSAIHKSQNRRQTLRQSTLVCIASRHGASPAQLICTYRWTWDEWKQWQAWLHKEILQVTNGWRSTSSVTDMGHHHGTGTNWDRKKIRRERYVATDVFTECWAAKSIHFLVPISSNSPSPHPPRPLLLPQSAAFLPFHVERITRSDSLHNSGKILVTENLSFVCGIDHHFFRPTSVIPFLLTAIHFILISRLAGISRKLGRYKCSSQLVVYTCYNPLHPGRIIVMETWPVF